MSSRCAVFCVLLGLSVAPGAALRLVAAADLSIGIGADVTAIDPHYYNVTPNNNVAAHIFDYLVLRGERQKLIPGLAEAIGTGPYRLVRYAKGDRIELARFVSIRGTRNGIAYIPRTDENTLAHKFKPEL